MVRLFAPRSNNKGLLKYGIREIWGILEMETRNITFEYCFLKNVIPNRRVNALAAPEGVGAGTTSTSSSAFNVSESSSVPKKVVAKIGRCEKVQSQNSTTKILQRTRNEQAWNLLNKLLTASKNRLFQSKVLGFNSCVFSILALLNGYNFLLNFVEFRKSCAIPLFLGTALGLVWLFCPGLLVRHLTPGGVNCRKTSSVLLAAKDYELSGERVPHFFFS